MVLGSVSVKGNYHKVNQDNGISVRIDEGFLSVVSDGLGSKRNSQLGSRIACRSAIETALEIKDDIELISPKDFVIRIHDKWISKLANQDVSECYTTLLVVFLYSGRCISARLGDGFVGIWTDAGVKILFDRKMDYFVNETDCLREQLDVEKIETYAVDIDMFYGSVICSDGVGIGNSQEHDYTNFTRDFVNGYSGVEFNTISNDIETWLNDWTGSDDKTLSFCIA